MCVSLFSQNSIGLDGLRFPFDVHKPQRLGFEPAPNLLIGMVADDNGSGLCHVLYAESKVHGISQGGIFCALFAANLSQHHDAGIKPNPGCEKSMPLFCLSSSAYVTTLARISRAARTARIARSEF
jgi:hypothetical protein